MSRDGRKVFGRALPNDEERLRALYEKLADHGNLLVVVDQPATIGALAVAVAQDMGITVGNLPGLSMRRIADLTPGSAKTDAKDAAVIAQAARTMPHTLRTISTSDEDAAALSMLTGFDLDLARQVNQTANRIRGLTVLPQGLTQTNEQARQHPPRAPAGLAPATVCDADRLQDRNHHRAVAACPALSTQASTPRPASTAAWILVDHPPRERPRA